MEDLIKALERLRNDAQNALESVSDYYNIDINILNALELK